MKKLLLLLILLTPITTFAKTKLYDMIVEQSTGYTKYQELFYDNPNKHGVTKWFETVNDDDYEVYIFTGSNSKINNYVRIDDMCFNILRTTYSNGVKLTYYGPYEDGECVHERISGYYNYDSDISIKHVGYMYGTTPISYDNEEDISSAFLNQNDSDIKKKLDRFYEERLTDYNDWMNDDIYCNDRRRDEYHLFLSYHRYSLNNYEGIYESDLSCAMNDAFTVNNESGNKKLTYPIGTVSYEEVELSRKIWCGYGGYSGDGHWIYDRYGYAWTMTPANSDEYHAYVLINFNVSGQHGFSGSYALNSSVDDNLNIIPVISVNENVCVSTGSGTEDDPYVLYYDDGVIRGHVVWDDSNNIEGTRPEQVSIKIYADGTVIDEIIVKASDDWKFEIKADEYSTYGNKISYILTQNDIEEYELNVTGSFEEGYTLTNTRKTKETTNEEVKADKEEQKTENPKTGRNNTIIISLSILVLMIGSYFFIRKHDLFKSNL